MTDGIIQEVFKRNKNLNISLRYRTHLERIEQELIEKIKGESWNLYPSQILDKLIGDTE